MTDREPTAAENEALRARISALSAASLRISASLDLETVLNEIVDSARALIPPSGMPDSRWGFPSGPISDSMW